MLYSCAYTKILLPHNEEVIQLKKLIVTTVLFNKNVTSQRLAENNRFTVLI